MFDINKHQHDFFYNLATVIDGIVPDELCDALAARVNSIIAQRGVDWVRHHSLVTLTEQKLSVVYNYYERHDTYRHEDFDNFVYHGIPPKKLA